MQVSHDSKKTIAMRDQKIEFLVMQLKEAKDQLEESQRQHDSMVQALNKQHEVSDDEGQSTARLEMLQKEFEAATEAQMAQIKEIKAENDDLKQKLGDVEHQNKLNIVDLQRKLNEANQATEDIVHARDNLLERMKALDAAKQKLSEEADELVTKAKANFEQELAEKEEQNKTEVQEAIQRHEEQLAQMKTFYEMESEKRE